VDKFSYQLNKEESANARGTKGRTTGMQLLLGLSRTIDRLTEFIGKAVMWLILLAVLVSAGNAVVRKTFNYSSNAWLELQWYLFGAAFMMAAAYTLKQNDHIRVDVFYATRSRATQHWIDLFGHVFFLLPFVVLMTWQLVPYTLQAYNFALLTGQALSEIIKKVAVIRGLIDDPHPTLTAKEAAELEVAALVKEIQK
jgi:TRAP-type mannitol/chloroaromatic compound transport system permease small subunit